MKVGNTEVSDEQIAAGLAVMKGHFRLRDVRGAMMRAGLADGAAADRAADRLVQRERKAGRIQRASAKVWSQA